MGFGAVLNNVIRQLSLGFYLFLPFLVLICVGLTRAEGSGWFFFTGWCTAFIFQIFFLAVNQSQKNHILPLYKQAGALLVPLIVLIKQLVFGGGLMLYLLELMALEVLVLNIGVVFAMLLMAKEDWHIALFGVLFFSFFLISTFYGLYVNWKVINTDTSVINYYVLAFAILSGVCVHIKFLFAVGTSQIQIQDAKINNPVLFFVGQIVLWFVIMVFTEYLLS